MDSSGPLQYEPESRKDRHEYAFQTLNPGHTRGSRNERQPTDEIKADDALKNLLCSEAPVLIVEAYVALAPREFSRAHNLSEIVRAELALLLRRAKAEGIGVVFQLGGSNPHKLADRAYLKRPFTDNGLRCGYIRWRPSASAPWGREQCWLDRCCLGLQLP
jgi:hypothetical protein